VDLITGDIVGRELLAGEASCPDWSEAEWREWYAFLASEIPLLMPELQGLLFVNLDGHRLLDWHTNGSIRALRDFARRIVIEWTEQRFHDDKLVDVMAKFNFLKGLGFRIAIDDIGADVGVDGLGRAGAVKATFCKIDGPYFQAIREKGPDYLRGLCQHLSHGGARVIVKWVETEEDYRLALAAGAHLGQGWYWTHGARRSGPSDSGSPAGGGPADGENPADGSRSIDDDGPSNSV
jgi:EAL domain-containing protein (putative c-di-GMP-specific phosphodiesterase class I)